MSHTHTNPATAYFRLPHALPDGQAFALLPDAKGALPVACQSLGDLARCIHRRRRRDALRLADAPVEFADRVRDMVEVSADELDGDGHATGRTRLIGHAWLGGRDRRVLEAALGAVIPNRRA